MREELEQELCRKYPRLTRAQRARPYMYMPFFRLRIRNEYVVRWFSKVCKWFKKDFRTPVYYPAGYREPFAMFGFECGDGWYGIVDKMLEQLVPLCDEFKIYNDGHDPYICQLKEKFATLRVYMSLSNSDMDRVIRDAEDASARTCEACGKPGEVTGNRWYSTLCEEHAGGPK
jgi:hypothetical protein